MKKTTVTCLLTMACMSSVCGMEEKNSRLIAMTEGRRRIAEIKKLDDQAAIAEFVKNDPSMTVSLTALYLVDDQTLLADIVKNSIHLETRLRATRLLDDQAILEEVVKSDNDFEVRQAAVMKLHNQELLTEIAKNDAMLRGAAIVGLNDKTLLLEIAKNDESDGIRLATARKLDNQVIIAEIARNVENNTFLRQSAIGSLTNKAVLREFVKDKDAGVRMAVALTLNDQKLLEEFMKSDADREWRRQVIGKVENQTILAEIAEHDKDNVVSAWARDRLKYLRQTPEEREAELEELRNLPRPQR